MKQVDGDRDLVDNVSSISINSARANIIELKKDRNPSQIEIEMVSEASIVMSSELE
jgi:hypothetical protein